VDDVKMYWHPQEEIEHTFEPPPNAPNHLLALIFTGIVGAPLVFFILLQNSVTLFLLFFFSILSSAPA
jgi:hypothetical protein